MSVVKKMDLQSRYTSYDIITEEYNKAKSLLEELKLTKKHNIIFTKKHDAKLTVYSSLGMFNLNKDQFEQLWKQIPEERGKVFVFGKEHDVPRFCKSYVQSYTFSGREHKADPIDSIKIDDQPFLKFCLDYLKKETGKEFNQILINWYPDNQSYIGKHSDDESMFDECDVYCFNYCKRPRDLVIRRKKCDDVKDMEPYKLSMENNTGYAMRGEDFQKYYTHEVPKRATKEDRDERRISLTFRVFKTDD